VWVILTARDPETISTLPAQVTLPEMACSLTPH
jgi:hypothetical protein